MMKKTILTLMSAFALLFCREISAQPETTPRPERRRIAVYIVAGEGVHNDVKNVVTNQIISVLNKTDKYVLIERNNDFAQHIDNERKIQQSGNVRDDQITDLAKEFGAVAVCIAELVSFMGELSVDMRLTSVTTKTIIPGRTGSNQGKYNGIAEIRKIVDGAAAAMLGGTANGVSMQATSNKSGGHKNGEVYNPDGIEMVYVEGSGSGIFAVKSFYIGKYEVTQAQWQAVMGNNPSNFKGTNNPVEMVSWNDIQEFIKKLNAMTGRTYRLPTEAEWEYAAREGRNSSYEYSGSNTIDAVGWYNGNSGNVPHPVGQKSPNALGIYDMAGNVWEWCSNCYDSSCSNRVLHGGGWCNVELYCRVADRVVSTPGFRYHGYGFRLSLVP